MCSFQRVTDASPSSLLPWSPRTRSRPAESCASPGLAWTLPERWPARRRHNAPYSAFRCSRQNASVRATMALWTCLAASVTADFPSGRFALRAIATHPFTTSCSMIHLFYWPRRRDVQWQCREATSCTPIMREEPHHQEPTVPVLTIAPNLLGPTWIFGDPRTGLKEEAFALFEPVGHVKGNDEFKVAAGRIIEIILAQLKTLKTKQSNWSRRWTTRPSKSSKASSRKSLPRSS
jgi:hypothetical protein